MSEAVKIIVGEGESAEINVPGYGVIKGQDGKDGVSPVFTTQPIEGGYRLTITDAAHPDGQDIDLMDGAKGDPGTTVYSDLSNKPSINGVELVGNKSFEDLGEETITNTELQEIIEQQYSMIFGGT